METTLFLLVLRLKTQKIFDVHLRNDRSPASLVYHAVLNRRLMKDELINVIILMQSKNKIIFCGHFLTCQHLYSYSDVSESK